MGRTADKREVNLVYSLQNLEVLRQMAEERQAQLCAGAIRVATASAHPMRVWIGRRIVGLGAWIAREPSAVAAWAG